MFAYRMFYQNLNKNEKFHPTTFKMEMDWSNLLEREISFGINEIDLHNEPRTNEISQC